MQTNIQTGCPVPVPVPGTRSQKIVQPAEGWDLREEPEKGPRLAEPDAARRHEEPRALRRGLFAFTERDFRRMCVIVRGELATGLSGAEFIDHLKDVCAGLHLPYTGALLERAVDAVLTPRPEKPVERLHWRDRCEQRGHPRWCSTPMQCELRQAREARQ